MRAIRSTWCSMVLSAVASTGCIPLFTGEAAQAADSAGGSSVYQGSARTAGAWAPSYGGAPQIVQVPAGDARGPVVIVIRAPECCAGPVVVTLACSPSPERSSPGPSISVPRGMRPSPYDDEDAAPPPAPYKPSPYEGSRPPGLYRYD